MKDTNINSTLVLNNGVEIPILGLGTYLTKSGYETENAVHTALECGYRHIDTASIYKNEEDIGRAIKSSGIIQEDIFITTKVWNSDQGYDSTLRAFDQSLERLGMDYVDLYLIHWPQTGTRNSTWDAVVELYQTRRARSIGVSNYTIKHLEELMLTTEITPVVNQVELTPYLYQKDLIEYCHNNSIQVESYSPLVRGKKFNDPRLIQISEKYAKSAAQILIRWTIQKNLITLPKSATASRIRENADVFDFNISDDDMMFLDSFNENYRIAWDPSNIE